MSDIPSDQTDTDSEVKVRLTRRGLRRRKKYCPDCLSEIEMSSSLSGWLVPEFYVCEKCGYSGHVALERSEDKEKESS
ncbi:MAG: hypothetical protein JRN52_11365 [Nitrososphaerota archaeon]|nr:hypothetical protein [Nitrososphaerota archaeon]